MKVAHQPDEYYVKGSGAVNLETKIKMLNDVGVMKKRSPMVAIGNYFSRSEEVKDFDSFPITIQSDDGESSLLTTTTTYMKFDLISAGEGLITIASDPVFTEIRLSMSTRNILRIKPSTSAVSKNPEIRLELINSQETYKIELMVPRESATFKKRLSSP